MQTTNYENDDPSEAIADLAGGSQVGRTTALLPSSAGARKLTLASGRQAVVKPSQDRLGYDTTVREVAAYRFAVAMGYEWLVPPTTLRSSPMDGEYLIVVRCSAQLLITGTNDLGDLAAVVDEDIAAGATFDVLTHSIDRHLHNWATIVDSSGRTRLVLYDNGRTFDLRLPGIDTRLRSAVVREAVRRGLQPDLTAVRRVAHIRRDGLLVDLLNGDVLDRLDERIEDLLSGSQQWAVPVPQV